MKQNFFLETYNISSFLKEVPDLDDNKENVIFLDYKFVLWYN